MINDNKIYNFLNKLDKKKFCDFHLDIEGNFWLRNNLGTIQKTKYSANSNDIDLFLKYILTDEQYKLAYEGNEIDSSFYINNNYFRFNCFLSQGQMSLAIRFIAKEIPSFEEIGLDDFIFSMLNKKNGLIIISGPSGSGKSTTLACLIDYININFQKHIICIDDPVEFIYRNKKSLVTQRQIGKDTKSRDCSLKYVLRQDVDVISIGEIREIEGIKTALTLAETGHLVLTTIHTSSAHETLTRFIDVFPDGKKQEVCYQLSKSLIFIISQKLIEKATNDGRMAVREILVNTKGVSKFIKENDFNKVNEIMKTADRYGMRTFEKEFIDNILAGKIRIENVMPYIENKDSFKNLLKSFDSTI